MDEQGLKYLADAYAAAQRAEHDEDTPDEGVQVAMTSARYEFYRMVWQAWPEAWAALRDLVARDGRHAINLDVIRERWASTRLRDSDSCECCGETIYVDHVGQLLTALDAATTRAERAEAVVDRRGELLAQTLTERDAARGWSRRWKVAAGVLRQDETDRVQKARSAMRVARLERDAAEQRARAAEEALGAARAETWREAAKLCTDAEDLYLANEMLNRAASAAARGGGG